MIKDRQTGRIAARTKASMASASRLSPRMRILVTLLALMALAIQTFGIQGHVHRLQVAGNAQGNYQHELLAGERSHPSADAQRHRASGEDDPAKCPFCQQLGNSQQLVTCSVVLVSFCYFVFVRFIATDKSARALFAVRHAWQSRAPPRQ